MKIYMVSLFHRATIKTKISFAWASLPYGQDSTHSCSIWYCLIHKLTHEAREAATFKPTERAIDSERWSGSTPESFAHIEYGLPVIFLAMVVKDTFLLCSNTKYKILLKICIWNTFELVLKIQNTFSKCISNTKYMRTGNCLFCQQLKTSLPYVFTMWNSAVSTPLRACSFVINQLNSETHRCKSSI